MKIETFKALVVEELGDKQFKREVTPRKLSDLPDGDVLVQVEYSSLNYKDTLSATGNKGITRHYPHTPGIDAAGWVVESRDKQIKEGDQVIVTGYDLGMNTAGGFSQYVRVPSGWIIPLPTGLSLKESMVYGTAGLTAAMSIHKLELNGLKKDAGEVLVTGATGGVGSMAVAILSRLGYQVVASTGKLKEKEFLISLGAHEVMDREELKDPSAKPLGKKRWAGVVDTVGGETLTTAIKTTMDEGSVSCCGMVTSTDLKSSIFPFILRGINLLGISSAEYPLSRKVVLWDKLADPWKIDSFDRIHTECGLDQLNGYIDQMLKGQITGRIVVRLDT